MILIPIAIFLVYAVVNSKRDVKQAATRKHTMESCDATTRLIVMTIVGVILLAMLVGAASL